MSAAATDEATMPPDNDEKDYDDDLKMVMRMEEEMKAYTFLTASTRSSLMDDDDEDEHDEQIQRIAESLAPQMRELDALLFKSERKVDATALEVDDGGAENDDDDDYDNNHVGKFNIDLGADDDDDDDDDSMEGEMARLAVSEQLLRQELEFAHDFGAMLSSTPIKVPPPPPLPPSQDTTITTKEEPEEPVIVEHVPTTPPRVPSSKMSNATSSTPGTTPPTTPRTPLPFNSSNNSNSKHQQQELYYTFADHSHAMQITKEPRGGWYVVPHVHVDPAGSLREYVIPLPTNELGRLYVGLWVEQQPQQQHAPADVTDSVVNNGNKGSSGDNLALASVSYHEALPLRLISVKLRPDVLVGAIMEAVASALGDEADGTTILRRQGGHLEAVCLGGRIRVDAQVTTYKGSGGRFCERTLLVRCFYYDGDKSHISSGTPGPLLTRMDSEETMEVSKNSNLLLKEAAALVQVLETSKKPRKVIEATSPASLWNRALFSPSTPKRLTRPEMQDAVRNELLSTYKPCPSVRDGAQLTLPVLSRDDMPSVVDSWKIVRQLWEELESRDLTYNTLSSGGCGFGQFPALPTLDVHYCSQLRRVCRENMIVSLLKSASELEDYAREAEYACANLVQVLKATYEAYNLAPPSLPQPLPLTAYPLDFVPHQSTCPPWGRMVMEALQKVAAMSTDPFDNSVKGGSSLDRCEIAVQMVLDAFQVQDDEEQSARLGRKNLQVMDRLAKMQAHKRVSMAKLDQSYDKSRNAKAVADEVHYFTEKIFKKKLQQQQRQGNGNNVMDADLPEVRLLQPHEQVPLFRCSIIVGSSTGTCYVTSKQIVCATHFISSILGTTVNIFDFKHDLEFVVQGDDGHGNATTPSLLNPLPTALLIRHRSSVSKPSLLIRPSYGAARLKAFLEVVQATTADAGEDDEGSGSGRADGGGQGSLLHVYGDQIPEAPSM